MRLINLGQQPEDKPNSLPDATDGRPDTNLVIDQLRARLLSRDFHDSVEVKTAVLGELIYQCYIELQKRRYL